MLAGGVPPHSFPAFGDGRAGDCWGRLGAAKSCPAGGSGHGNGPVAGSVSSVIHPLSYQYTPGGTQLLSPRDRASYEAIIRAASRSKTDPTIGRYAVKTVTPVSH